MRSKELNLPYSPDGCDTHVLLFKLFSKLEQLRHTFDVRAIAEKVILTMPYVRSRRDGAVFIVNMDNLTQSVVVDIHVLSSISRSLKLAFVCFLVVDFPEQGRVVLFNLVYFHEG